METVSGPSGPRMERSTEVTVRTLDDPKGTKSLGFSIRGGFEHGTSLYVSQVESDSAASVAGLKVGDEILTVNGFSLAHCTHDESVLLVKSLKHLSIKVKHCGLLPVKEHSKNRITWRIAKDEKIKTHSKIDPNSDPTNFTSKNKTSNEIKSLGSGDGADDDVSHSDIEVNPQPQDNGFTEINGDKFLTIV